MMDDLIFDARFTAATVLVAEGARIGIVTCKECGAAVIIDPRDTINALRQHHDWHALATPSEESK